MTGVQTCALPIYIQVRHIASRTAEFAYKRMLRAQHDAALWRYAPPLISARARAENIMQETLLRAWEHPEIVDDVKRSGSAR